MIADFQLPLEFGDLGLDLVALGFVAEEGYWYVCQLLLKRFANAAFSLLLFQTGPTEKSKGL